MRVTVHSRENIIARAARNVTKILKNKGLEISIQWILSHVEILDNERVDRFAAEAHRSPSGHQTTHALSGGWCGSISTFLRRSQGHTLNHAARGICLEQRPVFSCACVGCVFSGELLHRLHRMNSPLCSICGALETTSHLLSECRVYEQPRKRFAKVLALHHLYVQSENQLIFPSGSRHHQKQLQRPLVFFLGDSGSMNKVPSLCVILILRLNHREEGMSQSISPARARTSAAWHKWLHFLFLWVLLFDILF